MTRASNRLGMETRNEALEEDERDSRRLLHCNVSNADCRRSYWHSLNPSKLQLQQLLLGQRDKSGSLGSRRFMWTANRRLAHSIDGRASSSPSHKTGAWKMRLFLRVRWWLQRNWHFFDTLILTFGGIVILATAIHTIPWTINPFVNICLAATGVYLMTLPHMRRF